MMAEINTDNLKAAQSFILYLFVQLFKQQTVAAVSLNATCFYSLSLCERKQMTPTKITEIFDSN